MKLYCPLSGVSYKTVGYGNGQAPHPIFYLPLEKLIETNMPAFLENKLSPEEVHLFGCAILHKLPVVWVHPVELTKTLSTKWYNNIEKLAGVACSITPQDREKLPELHINKATSSLSNLKVYLETLALEKRRLDFGDIEGTPKYVIEEQETRLLGILRRMVQPRSDFKELPTLMADWAAACTPFPEGEFTNLAGKKVTIAEHWKYIIRKCYETKDYLDFINSDCNVTLGDIDDLVEFCEDNMELGSIHSLHLMAKLRAVRSVIDEFRAPVSVAQARKQEAEETISILLSDSANAYKLPVEKAAEAPTEPKPRPIREDYESFADFFKAKLAWQREFGE